MDSSNIFILSPCPKSGSSMLTHLIGQHPNFGVGKHHFELRENYMLGKMLDTMDWVAENPTVRQLVDPNEDMVRNIHAFYWESIDQTDELAWHHHQSDYLGVKFSSFKNFQFLRYLFPNNPFIVIVRDPHDWYCSFNAWQAMQGEDRVPVHTWIDRYWRSPLRSLQKTSDELYRIVKYEDMIESVPDVINSLYTWMGWEQRLMKHKDLPLVFTSTSTSPNEPMDHRGICTSRVGHSNGKLVPSDIEYLNLAISEFPELGYRRK